MKFSRFFKKMFMKNSKLFKGKLELNYTTTKLEKDIDTLLQEICLSDHLSKSKVKNYKKMDIEVVIALMNAKLETAKGIQFGIMFSAFLFVSLTGLFTVLFSSEVFARIYIIIVALITVTVIEWPYRSRLMNYTYLKELLLIYKNEKFKDK